MCVGGWCGWCGDEVYVGVGSRLIVNSNYKIKKCMPETYVGNYTQLQKSVGA